MTGDTDTGTAEAPRPVAAVYDDISSLLAELAGGSLHEGYWESDSDPSTMAEASLRLTDLLVAKLDVGPGHRVLDIGCGTGGPAIRLAQSTGAHVTGVTNSAGQGEQAARNAELAGVGDRITIRCADASVLAFPDDSFDAVLMIESIFHLAGRLEALREVARVLRPGGRLVVTDLLDLTPTAGTPGTTVDELDEDAQSRGYAPAMAKPIRLASYPALLERAGLIPSETTDVTAHTVSRTHDSMRQRLADDRADLVQRFGSQVVDHYASVLPLLKAAGFGYGIVVATAPAG